MLKKNILPGFLLLLSATLFAQKERVDNLPTFDSRKLHYGFYLGINQNDFKLNLKESNYPNAQIQVLSTAGFNVGLIADFRLHDNLNLRFEPGLMSNTKSIIFNHLTSTPNPQDSVREIGSTYLHVPLVLKMSTNRLGNLKPYLLAGISYDHNFSSNEANQDDNASGEFRLKTNNFMYELGMGIDFYLPYFKFSPSIRGVFALNNEIKYDDDPNSPWTSPVNFLGTRGIFLTFAFE
jgi:hypothetical protein